MTLTFVGDRSWLCMSIEQHGKVRVLCRVWCDDTDIGEQESLSTFVQRHEGIDGTLKYMKAIAVNFRDEWSLP